ncbi:MAG: hypothetical protein WDN09_03655 [bacterium]
MERYTKKYRFAAVLMTIALGMAFAAPVFFAYAQNPSPTTGDSTAGKGLVPCGKEVYKAQEKMVTINGTQVDAKGTIKDPCTLKTLLDMVNNVVHFILFFMVVPIGAIMMCYAGFLLVTGGGEEARKTKAKELIWNVVWGLVIAIAAWLIVETILKLLGYDGSYFGF